MIEHLVWCCLAVRRGTEKCDAARRNLVRRCLLAPARSQLFLAKRAKWHPSVHLHPSLGTLAEVLCGLVRVEKYLQR